MAFEKLKIEEIGRYPSAENPLLGPKIFTRQHPLIVKFSELVDIVSISINEIISL